MLPLIYHQKIVHYKHSAACFYPTSAFTVSQALVLFPLQLAETILFTIIVYWSAGLSPEGDGARFFSFIVILFTFSVSLSQFYRLLGFTMPSMDSALPASGIVVILMILFSGFILPRPLISDGWIWFYWLNPVSWGIKAVTINEYKASRYDFTVCASVNCTVEDRFGDFALRQYGNPIEEEFKWYSLGVIAVEFFSLLLACTLVLHYVRWEASPPPPLPLLDEITAPDIETIKAAELPFEPVTFAFKDIGYRVTLKDKTEKVLLKGVSGFFEPGTMTALMGSSGAGKTTLLDVLAGRKNSGTVSGHIAINGKPKIENHFRRIMVGNSLTIAVYCD